MILLRPTAKFDHCPRLLAFKHICMPMRRRALSSRVSPLCLGRKAQSSLTCRLPAPYPKPFSAPSGARNNNNRQQDVAWSCPAQVRWFLFLLLTALSLFHSWLHWVNSKRRPTEDSSVRWHPDISGPTPCGPVNAGCPAPDWARRVPRPAFRCRALRRLPAAGSLDYLIKIQDQSPSSAPTAVEMPNYSYRIAVSAHFGLTLRVAQADSASSQSDHTNPLGSFDRFDAIFGITDRLPDQIGTKPEGTRSKDS